MNLKKILYEKIPFLQQIKELKNPQILKADIIAGITVAIILIPQAMAYSSLVGVSPTIGLYTAFLPVIIGGIFSSSRQLSTGPVTIISLMTGTTLAPLFVGLDMSDPVNKDLYVSYVTILALLVGIIQILFGILKLGAIFNFISHNVIIGFINAAAIIIIITQSSKILGVELPNTKHFYETFLNLIYYLTNFHLWTLIIGIFSLIVIYFLKYFFPNFPRYLFVVIISILISKYIGFDELGGKIVGDIPSGLPSFYIPNLSVEVIEKLFFGALVIAFMGFTEAISIAKAIGLETKRIVSTNQMLFSEGFANLASAFTKGYPISGTFARSAVNYRAGAKTQFSSIVAGLMVGIFLLFFTKYLYYLPYSTLAAIIISAVTGLFTFKPIKKSWKIEKKDAIISIITFVVTLVFAPHLEIGILTGVFLSLVLHLYQSMKPRFAELSLHKDGVYRDAKLHGLKTSKKVAIYRFYGKLFFVNIWYYQEMLLKFLRESPETEVVILDFELTPYLDSTAIEVIESLVDSLKKDGIEVYFTSLRSRIIKQFKDIGFIKKLGKNYIFPSVSFAVKFLKKKKKNLDLTPLLVYSPIKKI